MMNNDTTSGAEDVILSTITELLQRRGGNGGEVRPESSLLADLGMDSLEVAELSTALADTLGRDPFSEGILPDTVGELIGFYATGPQPQ